MNERLAIYPGSFDPMTGGHEDLVRRAARMFDKVLVAVAVSENKKPLFSLQERTDMARAVLGNCPNVEVCGFDCLLVDLLRQRDSRILVRGLRATSDFEYEFQLAGMNRRLSPGLETVFLTPADEYMFVSGSMVREIARLGGDVRQFVHPLVNKLLQQKFAELDADE